MIRCQFYKGEQLVQLPVGFMDDIALPKASSSKV